MRASTEPDLLFSLLNYSNFISEAYCFRDRVLWLKIVSILLLLLLPLLVYSSFLYSHVFPVATIYIFYGNLLKINQNSIEKTNQIWFNVTHPNEYLMNIFYANHAYVSLKRRREEQKIWSALQLLLRECKSADVHFFIGVVVVVSFSC